MRTAVARMRAQRAFTLIELLVVILVIAVLLGVALPSFLGQQNRAHDSVARQHLANAARAGDLIHKAGGDAFPERGDAAEPATGSMLAELEASEPQLTFGDAVGARPEIIQVFQPAGTDQRMVYATKSRSGTIFCVESVRADGDDTQAGLWWSWGSGAQACGDGSMGGMDPEGEVHPDPFPVPDPPTVNDPNPDDEGDTGGDDPGPGPGPGPNPLAEQDPVAFDPDANLEFEAENPSVSADGTKVTFQTLWGILPEDTNNQLDIYLYDRAADELTLVSRADGQDGAVGSASSLQGTISPDGQRVVFLTSATNLGASNGQRQAVVRDLTSHTNTVVSRATGAAGALSNAHVRDPAICDGPLVMFQTAGSSIHTGAVTGGVYLRNTDTHATTKVADASVGGLLSQNCEWVTWNKHSGGVMVSPTDSISATDLLDGTFPAGIANDGTVAYFKQLFYGASDPRTGRAIVLRPPGATSATPVSLTDGTNGQPVGNVEFLNDRPLLSADGNRIVFTSARDNTTAEDRAGVTEVFVRDIAAGRTYLASTETHNDAGLEFTEYGRAALSANGRVAVFDGFRDYVWSTYASRELP